MGVGACKVNLRGYEMGGRGPLLFVVVDIRVVRGSVGSPQSSSVWDGGVLVRVFWYWVLVLIPCDFTIYGILLMVGVLAQYYWGRI